MAIMSSRRVGDALLKRGLVPEHYYNAEILIGLDGAMSIRYEVYVTGEHLQKLSEAFAEIATGKVAPSE